MHAIYKFMYRYVVVKQNSSCFQERDLSFILSRGNMNNYGPMVPDSRLINFFLSLHAHLCAISYNKTEILSAVM